MLIRTRRGPFWQPRKRKQLLNTLVLTCEPLHKVNMLLTIQTTQTSTRTRNRKIIGSHSSQPLSSYYLTNKKFATFFDTMQTSEPDYSDPTVVRLNTSRTEATTDMIYSTLEKLSALTSVLKDSRILSAPRRVGWTTASQSRITKLVLAAYISQMHEISKSRREAFWVAFLICRNTKPCFPCSSLDERHTTCASI